MRDIYLYDNSNVLKNMLDIHDKLTLEIAEAELSRDNMITLYDRGFHNFSAEGLCEIHEFLFQDIYEWAGKYRVINISKREEILGGISVWYSNDENIERDLTLAWNQIDQIDWEECTREEFAKKMVFLMMETA